MENFNKLPKDILVKILTEEMSIETQIEKLVENHKLEELRKAYDLINKKFKDLLHEDIKCEKTFSIGSDKYILQIGYHDYNDGVRAIYWFKNTILSYSCIVWYDGVNTLMTFKDHLLRGESIPSESIDEIVKVYDEMVDLVLMYYRYSR